MEVVDSRYYSQDIGNQHCELADFVEEYGPITANLPVFPHVVDGVGSVTVLLIVGEEEESLYDHQAKFEGCCHGKHHRVDLPCPDRVIKHNAIEDDARHLDRKEPEQDDPIELVILALLDHQRHEVDEEAEADDANYVDTDLSGAAAESSMALLRATQTVSVTAHY